MKKKDILHDIYDFTPDDKAIIDISLETSSDVFNSFDKKASYYKRDLDQDFEDYLVESVKELDGHPFIIRLNIENGFDSIIEDPIIKAIHNYFRYEYWREKRNVSKELKKFLYLTLLGTALMAFYYEQYSLIKNFDSVSMYSKLIIEGIDIAGWVALWEAFTCIIFGFSPINKKLRHYKSLSQATIEVKKA